MPPTDFALLLGRDVDNLGDLLMLLSVLSVAVKDSCKYKDAREFVHSKDVRRFYDQYFNVGFVNSFLERYKT